MTNKGLHLSTMPEGWGFNEGFVDYVDGMFGDRERYRRWRGGVWWCGAATGMWFRLIPEIPAAESKAGCVEDYRAA